MINDVFNELYKRINMMMMMMMMNMNLSVIQEISMAQISSAFMLLAKLLLAFRI